MPISHPLDFDSRAAAQFPRLELNISHSKQQLMFAYANAMVLDDRITREEFMAAWDWLEAQMSDAIAASLGLSDLQLWLSIATLAILLLATFAFLLMAVVAFHTNGGFAAVVQSAAISASGVASKSAMRAPKAEELDKVAPGELKGLIKAGVSGSKEKEE